MKLQVGKVSLHCDLRPRIVINKWLESQLCSDDRNIITYLCCSGIAFRIEKASDWFHVARSKEYGKDNEEGNGLLLGFVNGTLSTQQHLTHESMSNHEPEGNGE